MPALPTSATAIAALVSVASDSDHIDVKTYRGHGSLEAFVAGFMGYHPAWVKALYAVRWGFVRLLGMRQQRVPDMGAQRRPQDVPMQPGQKAAIFTVDAAEADRYWLVSATDTHLTAHLCIIAEPADDSGVRTFHVITLVHYRNWTGPVYFNVIRPFHHLVVGQMSRAGLASASAG